MDGRTTRWKEHREARRDHLTREIRRVVHERGPDISMEEIATRLGTSKSILYRYFQDKTALQVALGDYILGRARAHLAEAARSSQEPRRAVEAMVETYLEIVERSRNVFLFINRPQTAASEGNLRTFVTQIESLVAEVLAPLVGEQPCSPRMRVRAAAIVGLVRAGAEVWATAAPADRIPRGDLAAELTALGWDGVRSFVLRAD